MTSQDENTLLDLAVLGGLVRSPDEDEALVDVLILLAVVGKTSSVNDLVDALTPVFTWRNEVPLAEFVEKRWGWLDSVVVSERASDSNSAPIAPFVFGGVRTNDVIGFADAALGSDVSRGLIAKLIESQLSGRSHEGDFEAAFYRRLQEVFCGTR